ncbi:ATP-grasp domain-containing protein [Balneolales bacterium ANBcel1]|nr:ATP-grasp domain-containing protein [Balneolales bacterium ANBcel1]
MNTNKAVVLLGWSAQAIESAQKLDKPYVVVSFEEFEPYAKENGIPFVAWDFNQWGDQSNSLILREKLAPFNPNVAIPLYEETVEWAGALNTLYRDDPRVMNRAFLFRNKAMMKRKALLAGLRVGLFEEVHNKQDVHKFMDRLNEANLVLKGEEDAWVHLKPFSAAGTVGHKLLRNHDQIDEKVIEKDFPCLVESHLPGQEFSCEAFIHNGKIRFMNITEYIRLGYSNYIPAGPDLQSKRPQIREVMQKLVDAFGIEYGVIHPEWFLTEDNTLSFGEVACRIPGGHIFELISKAYGFDAIQAMILCSDPDTTEEQVEAFFPSDEEPAQQYAGSLMVYPKPGKVSRLIIPEELKEDPYFENHTLTEPMEHKVSDQREGFGNHYGTIFFRGEDPGRMAELLRHYENVDFYQG